MKTMIWNNWTDENEVPLGTWLLMEVNGPYPFQTGIFNKTGNDSILGVVGGHFHFDHRA